MSRVEKRAIKIVTVPRTLIYTWLATFLCTGALAGIGIQYANYVDQQSNAQWCDVVSLLDDSYRSNPPQTVEGKKLAEEMQKLRREFKCK